MMMQLNGMLESLLTIDHTKWHFRPIAVLPQTQNSKLKILLPHPSSLVPSPSSRIRMAE
ncbi:MAG: hypothetical protein RBJ76_27625 [Stenomitos frigidus ULC029]